MVRGEDGRGADRRERRSSAAGMPPRWRIERAPAHRRTSAMTSASAARSARVTVSSSAMPTDAVADAAQVEAAQQRRGHQRVGLGAGIDRDGVEEGIVLHARSRPRAPHPPAARADSAHARGDALQPLRAVPHRIHAGHDGEQHLRGADVRGRLLAADVLFARLQREAHRRRAGGIDRDADQPPRHQPLMRILHRHEAGMRPAKPIGTPKRWAEPTTTSAPISPGGVSSAQRERVGGDDGEAAAGLHGGDLGRQVAHLPGRAGILQHQGEGLRGADLGDDRGDRARSAPRCRAVPRASSARPWIAGAGRRRRSAGATCRASRRGRGASPRPPRSPSSSSEALAIGRPVRSQTMVWKFTSASRRPCAISAW